MVRFPEQKSNDTSERNYDDLLYIPVFNGGGSPIFDIEYELELVNINELEIEINKNNVVGLSEHVTFDFSIIESFINPQEKMLRFDYRHRMGESLMSNLEIKGRNQKYPMLKSQEEFRLYFDPYAIWTILTLNYSGVIDKVKPIFKIKMKYLDYNFQNRDCDFIINLDNSYNSYSSYRHEYYDKVIMTDNFVTFTMKPDFLTVKQQLEQQ